MIKFANEKGNDFLEYSPLLHQKKVTDTNIKYVIWISGAEVLTCPSPQGDPSAAGLYATQ